MILPLLPERHPDPSQLPLETRRLILHDVCEQLASGTSGRSMTDYAAVQRFSSPDLTEDVRSLLAKYANDKELTNFLLRMIWLGQLHGALLEAKQIALSSPASRYTRIAALIRLVCVTKRRTREMGFLTC